MPRPRHWSDGIETRPRRSKNASRPTFETKTITLGFTAHTTLMQNLEYLSYAYCIEYAKLFDADIHKFR